MRLMSQNNAWFLSDIKKYFGFYFVNCLIFLCLREISWYFCNKNSIWRARRVRQDINLSCVVLPQRSPLSKSCHKLNAVFIHYLSADKVQKDLFFKIQQIKFLLSFINILQNFEILKVMCKISNAHDKKDKI